MCFLTHFYVLHHEWQMTASVSTSRSKQVENSGGHCSKCLLVNWGHGVWSIQTCFTILHTSCIHTCASLLISMFYIMNDKWCPQCKLLGASKKKTVVGITANTFLWIEDMEYNQFKTCFTISHTDCNHTCPSLLIFILLHQEWQMMASGSTRSKQEENIGGHCIKRLFVNW
jgi:hypothetical protein